MVWGQISEQVSHAAAFVVDQEQPHIVGAEINASDRI